MALNIISELDRINQIIGAIKSFAQSSLDQAFPDNHPPHWAITLDLLANLGNTELEQLHNRLTAATRDIETRP